MTDIVYIQGLSVETTIGVYDWERTIKQTLVLDLEMGLIFFGYFKSRNIP